MKNKLILFLIYSISCSFYSCTKTESKQFFEMKGIVLSVQDLETTDWPAIAAENGINTIGTHMFPNQVLSFIQSDKGQAFLQSCRKYGIAVEHQLHAMKELLPRELYVKDSTMFRMNEEGRRVADFNCCVSSDKALEIIANKTMEYAKLLPPTNHRYYFWLDDGAPTCQCSSCSKFTASEQALIIENKMIKALKTLDPQAQLAHLAYYNTLDAPQKIKPEAGIFLEFAPFFRTWEKPLSDISGEGRGMKHSENLKYLHDNLKVFPVETAVILEYWLDVSLFSNWRKPAVNLPWHKDVFESDIDIYAKSGIKNITSFAVYMDADYLEKYPAKYYLKEYGEGLNLYRIAK